MKSTKFLQEVIENSLLMRLYDLVAIDEEDATKGPGFLGASMSQLDIHVEGDVLKIC